MRFDSSKKLTTFHKLSFLERLDGISFNSLCLLIVDCTVSGGGRWFMIGPLSLRMILGIISFVCAIPKMVNKTKHWMQSPMVYCLVAFVLYLGISALIGISHQNNIDVLFSDIKGFLWLFLVPIVLAVVDNRERIHIIMKCIVVGATIQAALIIGLNIFCIYFKNWYVVLHKQLLQLQVCFLDNVTGSLFRVFFKSSPYLIVGCVCMLYYQIVGNRLKWLYSLCTAICLNAILISFTRSLYGAAGITAAIVIILHLLFNPLKWKTIVPHIVVTGIFFMVLIAVQQHISKTNYFRFAVSRTLLLDISQEQKIPDNAENPEKDKLPDKTVQADRIEQQDTAEQQEYIERTKISDSIVRNTVLEQLKSSISKSPLFGNGLGATIEFRSDGYVEYFYFDILNKMGIIGFLLYLFPVGYMVYILLRGWRKSDKQLVLLHITWISGLAAFLFASYFNPYLNAALGISCYSIVIGYFINSIIIKEKMDTFV